MHSSQRKTTAQPDVSSPEDGCTAASDGHVHDWAPLALGFEMCVGCGKIRRTPKNLAAGQPHPRRPIAVLVAVARRRLRRLSGRDAR